MISDNISNGSMNVEPRSIVQASAALVKRETLGVSQTLGKLQTIIASVEMVRRGASSRGYCATFTFLTGVAKMLTGNLFFGAVTAGAGAVELYKIFGNHQTNDLQRLLSDTSAGLEMLQALDVENRTSLRSLESDLAKVETGIQELTGKLSQVEAIATNGNAELEKLKTEAKAEYAKAIELQQAVLKTLTSAKVKLEQGTETLAACKKGIGQMGAQANQTVAREDLVAVLDEFQALAEKTVVDFSDAQGILSEANDEVIEAISLLHASNQQNERAITLATTAIVTATERLTAIVAVSQHEEQERVLQARIDAMEAQIQLMERRAAEQEAILSDAQQNVQEAQEVITFGLQSVIFGGCAGAAVGNLLGVPVIGAPIGVMAYHNWHNGGVLAQASSAVTQQVGRAVNGPELPVGPDATTNRLKFTFDKVSSGWAGWALGRRSKTKGTVEFTLGGQKLKYGIDLNSNKPMAIEDMVGLRQLLMSKVRSNPALAKEARGIIQDLKTLEINRGKQGVVVGVIAPNSPYFGVDFEACMASA